MPWILKNIWLIKNWVEFYKGSLHLKLRNGIVLDLPSRHDLPMVHEVMAGGVYGDLSTLPLGATIIDLGANLGSFTLLALNTLPTAQVFAYEGASRTAEILRRNIMQSGFWGRGFSHHLAVSDKAGEAEFLLTTSGNTGHNYLVGAYDDKDYYENTTKEKVKCTTLDTILKETGHCDFLKIDIEGAEYKVIYASKLLGKKVDRIGMEYHGTIEKAEELAAHLRKLDFIVRGPVDGFIFAEK